MAGGGDAAMTVSQTASVAMGTAAGGDILLWVIDCIQAGHLVTPDRSVAMVAAAALAPFCHAIGRLVLRHLDGGVAL